MTLEETIKINKKIMDLIKSRYDDTFPDSFNSPESRYYERLDRETEQAEQYLDTPTKK